MFSCRVAVDSFAFRKRRIAARWMAEKGTDGQFDINVSFAFGSDQEHDRGT